MTMLYQVDAFAQKVFEGNPAAVVPLQAWPPDRLLQAIAAENNLAETAFIIGDDKQWGDTLVHANHGGRAVRSCNACLCTRRVQSSERRSTSR